MCGVLCPGIDRITAAAPILCAVLCQPLACHFVAGFLHCSHSYMLVCNDSFDTGVKAITQGLATLD